MKFAVLPFALALSALASSAYSQEGPQPLEYVRVCDAFGTGFYYIPGTETCVRPTDGRTAKDTAGGEVFSYTEQARRLQRVEADTAISTALEDPDLIAGERFGVRVNWGAAGGQNAAGVSGSAVVTDGLFGEKGRVTASGGVGFTNGRAAGRAGMQLTW